MATLRGSGEPRTMTVLMDNRMTTEVKTTMTTPKPTTDFLESFSLTEKKAWKSASAKNCLFKMLLIFSANQTSLSKSKPSRKCSLQLNLHVNLNLPTLSLKKASKKPKKRFRCALNPAVRQKNVTKSISKRTQNSNLQSGSLQSFKLKIRSVERNQ